MNIDQYISAELRKKCYQEWVHVRRCAIRNLGDSFALKINMTRQIEPDYSEEELIENIKSLYQMKADVLRIEKNQFGFPEEEESSEEEEEQDSGSEEEENSSE
jgi:hypothetical protein